MERLCKRGQRLVVDVLVDYVAFFVEDFVFNARANIKLVGNVPVAYVVNLAVVCVY